MIKYSFIVPVYNTAKYLKKCLDSLVNQTFKEYEIIIVNDGSTDESSNIISNYEKEYNNIKTVNQENQGLSMARNEGVKQATGDYLIFIDSDDYVETNLLKEVDRVIEDNDILRFQIVTEDEYGNNKKEFIEKGFDTTTGDKAFESIANYHFVEVACCYAFSRNYWNKNQYKFVKEVYHEDFGLIPYVIYNAKKVCSISYIGYHYVQRNGSIMNNNDYNKTTKKAFDMLKQYKNIKNKILDGKNNYLLSYMANCTIIKARDLKKKERKEYIKELKRINVFDDVLVDSFTRKIKKIIMRLNLELYLKVVK